MIVQPVQSKIRTKLRLTVMITNLAGVLLSSAITFGQETNPTPQQLEFFEKQVRPLLAKHCYSCHSTKAKKLQAGLFVDSRSGLIKGGDSGEAIVPGDPAASLFMEAVRYESYEMPPKGKLSKAEISIFEKWIQLGAPWPEEDAPEARSTESEAQRRAGAGCWRGCRGSVVLP